DFTKPSPALDPEAFAEAARVVAAVADRQRVGTELVATALKMNRLLGEEAAHPLVAQLLALAGILVSFAAVAATAGELGLRASAEKLAGLAASVTPAGTTEVSNPNSAFSHLLRSKT